MFFCNDDPSILLLEMEACLWLSSHGVILVGSSSDCYKSTTNIQFHSNQALYHLECSHVLWYVQGFHLTEHIVYKIRVDGYTFDHAFSPVPPTLRTQALYYDRIMISYLSSTNSLFRSFILCL